MGNCKVLGLCLTSRWVAGLLVALVAALAPWESAAAAAGTDPPSAGTVLRTTGRVSLHAAPSASKVLLRLRQGEPILVLPREGSSDAAGEWLPVETTDRERGWVRARSRLVREDVSGERGLGGWPRALRSDFAPLDTRRLGTLLTDRGYAPGPDFMALVVVVREERGELRFLPFDHEGTSRARDGWWPASTVKLYAAVAALERVRALGFGPGVGVRFHYADSPVDAAAAALVRDALIPSDNAAFDRLVEIVGFDRINRGFFSPQHGLRRTVLLRSYAHRVVDPETGFGSLRDSPPITLREGRRKRRLPARVGRRTGFRCPDQGNCTTLAELAETLRRVMLHERLPEPERFALGEPELRVLREALSAPRERGMGVVEGLRLGFGDRPIETFHKPGYAYRWFSDVVFVRATDTGEQWIVALANRPGRDCLDEAARHIGELLAAGALGD